MFARDKRFEELLARFPNDEVAEEWLIKHRWGDKITCPKCGSAKIYKVTNSNGMSFRCRSCRRYFSVMSGTAFHSCNLGARAIVLFMNLPDSEQSMALMNELDLSYLSMFTLSHRVTTERNLLGEGF